tara:strand:+ start:50 stop:670 length:621 start_codon:yes stop_codon:yes gene_type:complete
MSRLLIIEGIDGAGKTTLAKGLVTALETAGHEVVSTREPGGSEKAETIRRRLFSEEGVNMTPAKQMEMMHEGRLDHIETVIKPALEAGKTVISDRFEMSSVVYQAWFDKEHLIPIYKKYEAEIRVLLGDTTPEYIYLTLDSELVKQRQSQSNDINAFDAVELEPIKDRIAAYEYAVTIVRGNIHRIDASQPPETVLKSVLMELGLK